jgi:dephospho-CoA kinase
LRLLRAQSRPDDGCYQIPRDCVSDVRVIGLTGGIASGKSTVANLLAQRDATVIAADELGHEIYQPGKPAWQAILDEFGEGIATDGGVIDRRKLGALVFSDSRALDRLTSITWPLMKEEMRRRLGACREAGKATVILEAAVLLEAGWDDLVDVIWVVNTPPETAIQRLRERSKLSEDEARARLAAQMSNAERAARADAVIDNSRSIEELVAQVDKLWESAGRHAA